MYIGCVDDRGTKHTIEQQFLTKDCRQCFCGNGGSISCNQTQCKSSSSGKFNTYSVFLKYVAIKMWFDFRSLFPKVHNNSRGQLTIL